MKTPPKDKGAVTKRLDDSVRRLLLKLAEQEKQAEAEKQETPAKAGA